jgi:hypothetical protein
VACAGGEDVLAAGEITFGRDEQGWFVWEITNQSTGFCPDPGCWEAVEEALGRIPVDAPEAFTRELILRQCPQCGDRNIVRDEHFVCAMCGAELPEAWNFGR